MCIYKGSSLNFDLMMSGNYVVIMIMLMSIYIYVYVCISLSHRVIRDHDYFMLMILYVYMYVCCCLIGSPVIILVEE